MKYLPFIFKHLRRNWVRTLSTVLAMAVCIFLFCTLRSVLAAVDSLLEGRSADRLVTRHAVSLVFNLPLSYENRIAAVPGVKRVAVTSWFGGSLPAKREGKATDESSGAGTDWSNFFQNWAVEPEAFLAMYPEYVLPHEQYRAFLEDQRGCLIGRKIADKYGWKLGDTFYLESFIAPYRKADGPFEFVVRGIFDGDPRHPDADLNNMYFQYKYLYEATGRRLGAGTYYTEIDDPDQAGAVSKAIDDLFTNSDAETHTETEKAFQAGFISMAGNLALLLNTIGPAVAFTILLVTANTMSMAIRERRTEIGVLKTLGFSSAQVMGLVVAEAVLLGVFGGFLGIGASQALMWTLSHAAAVQDMFARFGLTELHLKPLVAALGFAVALGLGFVAGFVPAVNAYRSRITDMLRTV